MQRQDMFCHAQEEMQKEVARQFSLLADDTWHTVDAAQSIEDVEIQVRPFPCAPLHMSATGSDLCFKSDIPAGYFCLLQHAWKVSTSPVVKMGSCE